MKKVGILFMLMSFILGAYTVEFGRVDFGGIVFDIRLEVEGDIGTVYGEEVLVERYEKKDMEVRYRGKIKEDKLICTEIHRNDSWDILEEPIIYQLTFETDKKEKISDFGIIYE